jgi:hypothetical protein
MVTQIFGELSRYTPYFIFFSIEVAIILRRRFLQKRFYTENLQGLRTIPHIRMSSIQVGPQKDNAPNGKRTWHHG